MTVLEQLFAREAALNRELAEVRKTLAQEMSRLRSSAFSFTERERTVFELRSLGRSNKEIGNQLNITERTVKFHASKILRKTGTSSFLELLCQKL